MRIRGLSMKGCAGVKECRYSDRCDLNSAKSVESEACFMAYPFLFMFDELSSSHAACEYAPAYPFSKVAPGKKLIEGFPKSAALSRLLYLWKEMSVKASRFRTLGYSNHRASIYT